MLRILHRKTTLGIERIDKEIPKESNLIKFWNVTYPLKNILERQISFTQNYFDLYITKAS